MTIMARASIAPTITPATVARDMPEIAVSWDEVRDELVGAIVAVDEELVDAGMAAELNGATVEVLTVEDVACVVCAGAGGGAGVSGFDFWVLVSCVDVVSLSTVDVVFAGVTDVEVAKNAVPGQPPLQGSSAQHPEKSIAAQV